MCSGVLHTVSSLICELHAFFTMWLITFSGWFFIFNQLSVLWVFTYHKSSNKYSVYPVATLCRHAFTLCALTAMQQMCFMAVGNFVVLFRCSRQQLWSKLKSEPMCLLFSFCWYWLLLICICEILLSLWCNCSIFIVCYQPELNTPVILIHPHITQI